MLVTDGYNSTLYFINSPTKNLLTSSAPHMWRLLAFLKPLQASEFCSDPTLGATQSFNQYLCC